MTFRFATPACTGPLPHPQLFSIYVRDASIVSPSNNAPVCSLCPVCPSRVLRQVRQVL
ncbi:hypothetical protein C8Q80DRAFT_1139467 [Daedaleopsis nitida]|nr:hypothetical protein C8Q80DRAFT_1139467 [Daedaleopsis nitida]